MGTRLLTAVSLVCAIVLGVGLLSPPAAAQDQGYYVYVSWWAVARSQWDAFEKQEESNIPTLQKLVADGTIILWGNAAVRVHQEDGYTHADWFEATSQANLLKALEIQWTRATNASFVATVKHHDLLLHVIAHAGKPSPVTTGYVRLLSRQAKPGEEAAREATWLKVVKPVLDAEVEKGTVLMYNFEREEVHTLAPGLNLTAIYFPSAEAVDKFQADITAAQKENPAGFQLLDSLTIGEASRETFERLLAYQHK